MRLKHVSTVVMAAVFAVINSGAASACGVFSLTAKDGTIVSGRTMEFGSDTHPMLTSVQRNTDFVSPAPDAKAQGLKWKTRYGYVGISVFGNQNMIMDGMNEAGLAASGLWYENNSKWPDPKPSEYKNAVAHVMVINWMLGSFSTVAEIKEALKKTVIFGLYVPEMKMAPPVHIAVYDATGAALVIEADNGVVHVYDNPLGVLTNAPNFPWMITNLRNYTALSNELAPTVNYGPIKLVPSGHGSGMPNLPGDLTPPSRFVRLAAQLHFADQAADAKGALALAMHMINSVEIVLGMAVDKAPDGTIISSESTQWSVARDLTNRVIFFRSYDNLNLRKVDLKKLDFTGGPVTLTPLYGDAEIITDITARLAK